MRTTCTLTSRDSKSVNGFAIFLRADAQNGGGRACAEIRRAVLVDGDGPDEGGRRGEDVGESGALAQVAVAVDGDALRRAFFEFLDAGLGPEMGALCSEGWTRKMRRTQ